MKGLKPTRTSYFHVADEDEVARSCTGGHFEATNSRAGNPKSVTDAEAAEIGRVLKDISDWLSG